MYIMYVCLFSALSRRVGALQISIIIINELKCFADFVYSLNYEIHVIKFASMSYRWGGMNYVYGYIYKRMFVFATSKTFFC